MSTASYRHLIVNKENPSTNACQENVTTGATSTAPKRRALGDVINTAISNRPVGLTPAKTGLNKFVSTNTPAKQQLAQRCVESVKTSQELPQAERFIPAPIDTFDDVFEDNLRLTDIFLNNQQPQQLKFIGRLPCSQSVYLDDKMLLDEYEIETDKEARRQLKRRNKSFKKRQHADVNEIRIFSDADLYDLSPVQELELTDSDLEIL